MNSADVYVRLEKAGDEVYCTLSGVYTQELVFRPTARQIRRLAHFFLALGKGRKRKTAAMRIRSGGKRFVFRVRLRSRGKRKAPVLSFVYGFWNSRFEAPADCIVNYFCFGREAFTRFGFELLRFNKAGIAVLKEKTEYVV